MNKARQQVSCREKYDNKQIKYPSSLSEILKARMTTR